jgi:hypothetical protein
MAKTQTFVILCVTDKNRLLSGCLFPFWRGGPVIASLAGLPGLPCSRDPGSSSLQFEGWLRRTEHDNMQVSDALWKLTEFDSWTELLDQTTEWFSDDMRPAEHRARHT